MLAICTAALLAGPKSAAARPTASLVEASTAGQSVSQVESEVATQLQEDFQCSACKHTVSLVNEELSPQSTPRAASFTMQHVCFRALWTFRPMCLHLTTQLGAKLQLAIAGRKAPCEALEYCVASSSADSSDKATSPSNITITVNINRDDSTYSVDSAAAPSVPNSTANPPAPPAPH